MKKARRWTPEKSLQGLHIFPSEKAAVFEQSLEPSIPSSPACNIHRSHQHSQKQMVTLDHLWSDSGHPEMQKIQLLPTSVSNSLCCTHLLICQTSSELFTSQPQLSWYPSSQELLSTSPPHSLACLCWDSSLLYDPYHSLPTQAVVNQGGIGWGESTQPQQHSRLLIISCLVKRRVWNLTFSLFHTYKAKSG